MTLPRGAAALLLGLPGTLVAQNVAEVQVAPPSITVKVGERSGLLATAFDRVGNVIPTVRVFWSSNNIQIARVDNNGTVTGTSPLSNRTGAVPFSLRSTCSCCCAVPFQPIR